MIRRPDKTPPSAAPINSAGPKTPPKKPKPIHIDVISILPNRISSRNSMLKVALIIWLICVPPKPKTSGINVPIVPPTSAVKRMREVKLNLELAETL